jgi:hypothetical protein
MDKKELEAIAQAAAKSIKTEAELKEFRQMLTKFRGGLNFQSNPVVFQYSTETWLSHLNVLHKG